MKYKMIPSKEVKEFSPSVEQLTHGVWIDENDGTPWIVIMESSSERCILHCLEDNNKYTGAYDKGFASPTEMWNKIGHNFSGIVAPEGVNLEIDFTHFIPSYSPANKV